VFASSQREVLVTATTDTLSSAVRPPGPAKKARRNEGTGRLAAGLLSPTFVVLGLVVLYPVISAVRQSLYQANAGLDENGFVQAGEKFVGMKNYTDIFSGPAAHRFWNAFYNTTFFTVVAVVIETALGLAMALVMHRAFRGRGLVRASVLVPWAIPTAVSAILWAWIFNSDNGIANVILRKQVLWTTEGFHAKVAVVIADTWKTAPFIGLLVLAGLQIIPQEIYEAAKVDGARAWRQFWLITLPLVKPALLVAVLFRLLDTLRMFDLPYVLIGARKNSVETLTMLGFDKATGLEYGPAAAYAFILFLYVVIVAFMFVKLLGADVIGDARQDTGKILRARPKRTQLTPEAAS
jgi:multiple sugar transport system permease protein